MAVYQPTSYYTNATGDFAVTILPTEAINPITGAIGVTTVKFDLVGATAPAFVNYVATSKTYSFADVAGTASGLGVDATFNVVVDINSDTVTLSSAGTGYAEDETITISGADVGGISPDNDIVVTVTGVTVDGEITSITSTGTPAWPQQTTGTVIVAPGTGSQFVQLNPTSPTDGIYLDVTGTDGDTYLQVVTIVG